MYQATLCMVSPYTHTHSLSLPRGRTHAHTRTPDVAKHIVAYKCVCERRKSESKFQRSKESHSVSFYSRILITLCAYLVLILPHKHRSYLSTRDIAKWWQAGLFSPKFCQTFFYVELKWSCGDVSNSTNVKTEDNVKNVNKWIESPASVSPFSRVTPRSEVFQSRMLKCEKSSVVAKCFF
jgi:hypothetical protein